MTALEKIQAYVVTRIQQSCAELNLNDLTGPFLVALYETSPGEYTIKEKDATDYFLSDEAKDGLVRELKAMCGDSRLAALAVSFDGYALNMEKDALIPDDLAEAADRETAIVSFLHLRDGISYANVVYYERKGKMDYRFRVGSWDKVGSGSGASFSECRFSNPFPK